MKRFLAVPAFAMMTLLLAPALRADVKTKERTMVKLEGFLGKMVGLFGGSSKDGITSTVAVKGNRKSSFTDQTGKIIDLTEEKVYDLDVKKKEYKVTTFEELRRRIKEERDRAAKQAKDAPAQEKNDLDNSGKQIEFEAEVKQTGQHKTIAGYDTHEVILTVTGHEKGKKIEDSGGFIMATDMWLGPRVAALEEIGAFEMKYFKAVYGDLFDAEQMAQVVAMYPSFSKMSSQMQTEGKKMDGTALFTTTTFESVKSAEEMKAAGDQQPSKGGGGLGGMLAKKLGGGGGPAKAQNLIMTSTMERLSIETSASAEDVAIPTGFKEKK